MIVHCALTSTYGESLSGHPDYQAIENKPFESLETFDISCGAPAPGYSLTGNVPPGLICETPRSTSTRLVASAIGSLFSELPFEEVVRDWVVETMTFPISGSDQGDMVFESEKTGTVVTKTFDFTLVYNGVSSGSPCSSSLGLTLIVMVDYERMATGIFDIIEEYRGA